MDDICAVLNNKNEAKTFFKHINSIHKNITFTQEPEKNKKLVIFDTETQKHDDKVCTKWHLKSANTGRFLHKSSYSSTYHKVAAIRSLIYHALRICSIRDLFEECYEAIEGIFITTDIITRSLKSLK